MIKLIKDINLSDRQVLKICQFLRTKWGKESITPNISKKLIKRKTILDNFFIERRLDSKSKYYFKNKMGMPLSRSVTYCQDIPGLITFKKLLENFDELKEVINLIGMDDGKNILKIVWNWSLVKNLDEGEQKLMGPKRTIILAAVSKV